jgi:hypothetical protein
MKLPGLLNLKTIGGQIAALVVASIITIHLILTATFLVYRPDQAAIERGNGQLAAVLQLLDGAPAAGRPRLFADIARISTTGHRKPSAEPRSCSGRA